MVSKKKPEEIKILKEGGKILSHIVHQVAHRAKPDISAVELDRMAEVMIAKAGAEPSFKNFQGYPSATCISINEQLVHGIPREGAVIKKGDIVSVDIGLKYKGLFTDMAVTVPIGRIPSQTKRLLKVTKKSLDIAIVQAKPGNTIGDIGYGVQTYVEGQGFSVVRSLVGHGVGYAVHEAPRVPNFGNKGEGLKLEPGMVLALEPMVNIGSHEVITLDDKWTIVTADGSLSAHFEHTIVITESGAEIITK